VGARFDSATSVAVAVAEILSTPNCAAIGVPCVAAEVTCNRRISVTLLRVLFTDPPETTVIEDDESGKFAVTQPPPVESAIAEVEAQLPELLNTAIRNCNVEDPSFLSDT